MVSIVGKSVVHRRILGSYGLLLKTGLVAMRKDVFTELSETQALKNADDDARVPNEYNGTDVHQFLRWSVEYANQVCQDSQKDLGKKREAAVSDLMRKWDKKPSSVVLGLL